MMTSELEEIIERYRPGLAQRAVKIGVPILEIEDHVQESILLFLKSFDPSRGMQPTTHLFNCVWYAFSHRAKRLKNKIKTLQFLEVEGEVLDIPDHTDRFESVIDQIDLSVVAKELSPKQLRCFMLLKEEASVAECAKILGVTRARADQLRKEIRAKLEPHLLHCA